MDKILENAKANSIVMVGSRPGRGLTKRLLSEATNKTLFINSDLNISEIKRYSDKCKVFNLRGDTKEDFEALFYYVKNLNVDTIIFDKFLIENLNMLSNIISTMVNLNKKWIVGVKLDTFKNTNAKKISFPYLCDDFYVFRHEKFIKL